jgi:hypothetical protein
VIKKVIDKQTSSKHHFKEHLKKVSFHTYANPTYAPFVTLHTSGQYSTLHQKLDGIIYFDIF